MSEPLSTSRLAGKVAIVTGSSSGLGRAIATRYADEGARVVCADLNPSARLPLAGENEVDTDVLINEKFTGRAVFIQTDVTNPGQMQSLVDGAVKYFGRLDIMVNNAGISVEARLPGPVHTCSIDTWNTTMTVNATSVFLGCKYAVAQMLKQQPHSSGDRGWIINISSIYGLVGGEKTPAYSASKGAVSNLTRAMSIDYAKDSIHCNAICPGHVQTAIFAETKEHVHNESVLNDMYPFKGPGKPIDIAKMAVVLASDDASWVTGACIPVDGGYVAR